MVMVNDEIEINTNRVYALDVSFLECIGEFGLVNHTLEGVQVKLESLIFLDKETPKIQNLVHWVLLEAS